MPLRLLLIFFVSLLTGSQARRFGCLNGIGEMVDWWVIYKEGKGLRYVYLDSTMDQPLGLNSRRLITHESSPLTKTVRSANYKNAPHIKISKVKIGNPFTPTSSPAQIRKSISEPFHVAWNDQPTKGSSSISEAHAKVNSLIP